MSYLRAMIIFFGLIGCTLGFANDANTPPKGLCIFDIDGTLVNLDHRVHYIKENPPN